MAIIDKELRVGDRVTMPGSGAVGTGTVVEIDDRKMFPVTVEWDDGHFITGHRRDQLLRVYYERGERTPMDKIETMGRAFAYNDEEGRAQDPPTTATIREAFRSVDQRIEAERLWLSNLRSIVRTSPKGIDVNELVGLSNQVEAIAKVVEERERSFRLKMRLVLRPYVAGDI
jgi:hypothetical protein